MNPYSAAACTCLLKTRWGVALDQRESDGSQVPGGGKELAGSQGKTKVSTKEGPVL